MNTATCKYLIVTLHYRSYQMRIRYKLFVLLMEKKRVQHSLGFLEALTAEKIITRQYACKLTNRHTFTIIVESLLKAFDIKSKVQQREHHQHAKSLFSSLHFNVQMHSLVVDGKHETVIVSFQESKTFLIKLATSSFQTPAFS